VGPRGGTEEEEPRVLVGNQTGVLSLVTIVTALTSLVQRSRENVRTDEAEHGDIYRLRTQTVGVAHIAK
jgi:hypothetical protein